MLSRGSHSDTCLPWNLDVGLQPVCVGLYWKTLVPASSSLKVDETERSIFCTISWAGLKRRFVIWLSSFPGVHASPGFSRAPRLLSVCLASGAGVPPPRRWSISPHLTIRMWRWPLLGRAGKVQKDAYNTAKFQSSKSFENCRGGLL